MTTLSKLALAAGVALLTGCATTGERFHVVAERTPDSVLESAAAWASLDQDADGTLSIDELEQQRAMGVLQDFPNADADGDRRVSKTEWDAWWPRMTGHYIRESSADLPLAYMVQ